MTESGGPPSRLKRAKKEAQDVAGIVGKTRSGIGKYAALVAFAAIIGAVIQGASVQRIGFGPLQIDFSSNHPGPGPTIPAPTTPAPTTGPTATPTTTPTPEPTTTPSVKVSVDASGMVRVVWPAGVPEARAVVVKASAKLVEGKVVITQSVENRTDQPASFMSGMGGVSGTDPAGETLFADVLDNPWQPNGDKNDYSVVAAHTSYTGTLNLAAPKKPGVKTLTLLWPLVQGGQPLTVPDIPIAK